jgi:hypothetical protein
MAFSVGKFPLSLHHYCAAMEANLLQTNCGGDDTYPRKFGPGAPSHAEELQTAENYETQGAGGAGPRVPQVSILRPGKAQPSTEQPSF